MTKVWERVSNGTQRIDCWSVLDDDTDLMIYKRYGPELKFNIAVDEDPVTQHVSGPFPTLDAAKAAYLILMAAQ